jgi:hypothetical protein
MSWAAICGQEANVFVGCWMVLGRGSLEGGGRKRREDDVKSIKVSGQACRAKMHINEGKFCTW